MRYKKFSLDAALIVAFLTSGSSAMASDSDLHIPDLTAVKFDSLGGLSGIALMYFGIFTCLVGAVFGLRAYFQTKALQVHESMARVSNTIWETCKTYLIQQGKFIAVLWALIAVC